MGNIKTKNNSSVAVVTNAAPVWFKDPATQQMYEKCYAKKEEFKNVISKKLPVKSFSVNNVTCDIQSCTDVNVLLKYAATIAQSVEAFNKSASSMQTVIASMVPTFELQYKPYTIDGHNPEKIIESIATRIIQIQNHAEFEKIEKDLQMFQDLREKEDKIAELAQRYNAE